VKAFALIDVGAPTEVGGLTVWPLFAPSTLGILATLDEALGSGGLVVEETTAEGVVGELSIANKGDVSLFILDGEQVIGLKQNRTFNLSMLLAPGQTMTAPVSCLELGRWSRSRQEVTSARHVHFSAGRARRMASVSRSLAANRSYASDQREVWRGIAERFEERGLSSSTEAEADLAAALSEEVEPLASSIPCAPGQVGAAFAAGGDIIGLDVFGSSELFAKLAPKLFRSYAAEARRSEGKPVPEPETITSLLKTLAEQAPQRFPAPGGGETARWEAGRFSAAALVVGGECVHLAALATR
jgi:hypothetical protein